MILEIWSVMDSFLSFWTIFYTYITPSLSLHPTPSTNKTKNQNFEKMKKTTGDIINLHKCTKNHDHMLDCSWHTTRDRCHSFILGYFLPFYPPPLTTQKIQIFKKWKKKKSLKILAFYTCVHPCMMDKQAEKVTYRGGCPT